VRLDNLKRGIVRRFIRHKGFCSSCYKYVGSKRFFALTSCCKSSFMKGRCLGCFLETAKENAGAEMRLQDEASYEELPRAEETHLKVSKCPHCSQAQE
jgi:hypothetical protein